MTKKVKLYSPQSGEVAIGALPDAMEVLDTWLNDSKTYGTVEVTVVSNDLTRAAEFLHYVLRFKYWHRGLHNKLHIGGEDTTWDTVGYFHPSSDNDDCLFGDIAIGWDINDDVVTELRDKMYDELGLTHLRGRINPSRYYEWDNCTPRAKIRADEDRRMCINWLEATGLVPHEVKDV